MVSCVAQCTELKSIGHGLATDTSAFLESIANGIPEDVELLVIGERLHSDTVSISFERVLVEYMIKEHGYRTIVTELPFSFSSDVKGKLMPHEERNSQTEWVREPLWLADLSEKYGVQYFGIDCGISLHAPDDVVALIGETEAKRAVLASSHWIQWIETYERLPLESWNLELLDSYTRTVDSLVAFIRTVAQPIIALRVSEYMRNSIDEIQQHIFYHRMAKGLKRNNYRDSIMFRNFMSLHEHRQPLGKTIMLVSNYHAMANTSVIRTKSVAQCTTVCERIKQSKFRDHYYSIAAINYMDMRDRGRAKSRRSRLSLEGQLADSEFDVVFVPLSMCNRPFRMSPLLDINCRTPWSQVYNSVLFFRDL